MTNADGDYSNEECIDCGDRIPGYRCSTCGLCEACCECEDDD